MLSTPPRTKLADDLEISRIVTGLWQVADLERGEREFDPTRRRQQCLTMRMPASTRSTWPTITAAPNSSRAAFSALGRSARRPVAFTKWCPTPGPMTDEIVREGVERARRRLGVETIDLMQFHWWSFEHISYLDAMKHLDALRREGLIRHLGVTNFDTAHLRVLVKHGIPVVANQVSFSLLDRRAAGEMSAFCLANGVRLLAYGTLAGGLMSERWLGRLEPGPADIADWSKSKYKRFIDAAGGWSVLQSLLAALDAIARKHSVSIANVAARWTLDHEAVAAVIIGARLGERNHSASNLKSFSFALDDDDRVRIAEASAAMVAISGDCGDEYRVPPFLTASGDLSHHLDAMPRAYEAKPVEGRPERWRVSSGSAFEPIAGYSRAFRIGDRILVSGTTATNGANEIVCPGDPAGQTTFILDKIAASLAAFGASLDDVVRTRVYLIDADHWEPVSRAHGRRFGAVRPANTLLQVGRLIGDYLVEIEAEAVLGP